ncbi:hypothetical protein EDB84DRAFT_977158 [Lactarius hengduanensis]|nr:hypothetical protein EDB84DRAFT_977158 [Lactarius hengduanensis]
MSEVRIRTRRLRYCAMCFFSTYACMAECHGATCSPTHLSESAAIQQDFYKKTRKCDIRRSLTRGRHISNLGSNCGKVGRRALSDGWCPGG